MKEQKEICSICESDFNLNEEGGITGNLGILPVAFCPFCLTGVMELTEQLMEGGLKMENTVRNEIRNFILWYFHQNENEATNTAKKLYDGIDTFMNEVYEEDE